jgi:hypothetical protein
MISRRLGLFWASFTPFLSQKGLISRRLRRFARKNSLANSAANETDRKTSLTANGHELTRMEGEEIGDRLRKAGALGIEPTVELSDSIPLGWADHREAQVVDFPHLRAAGEACTHC